LSSFKLSRRFEGHGREVTDIAFTPDGRRIITSSLDATVRVYDMPTGRCLSWMSFDAPIVSLCVSHSGEYLCVAQADKEGIYMYIDKSMYETVHFWREPTAPTPVADSRVLIEGEEGTEETAEGAVMEVTEENPKYVESTAQKASGSITLSSVAKAYWVSLFHLEAIKARNKPKDPLAPPPNVPFFLPTIKHGGATPSFPTPAEYKAMTAKTSEQTPDVGDKRKAEPEEEEVDFSGMTSVWDDAGEDATEEEEGDGEEVNYVIDTKPQSSSRIIRKKTVLPRCKLVAKLLSVFGEPNEEPAKQRPVYPHSDDAECLITEYFKSLPPPAVDVEVQALCLHENDEEGIYWLRCLFAWMTHELQSGRNFEVMQAYVFRSLHLYSEMLMKMPQLAKEVADLREVHLSGCHKFRDLVQSNLCLLKLFANIPSI